MFAEWSSPPAAKLPYYSLSVHWVLISAIESLVVEVGQGLNKAELDSNPKAVISCLGKIEQIAEPLR